MATKKITASVTLHVPDKGHTPFTYDALGGREGVYKARQVAPGTPVDLDEDEAADLIARGLAEEIVPEKPAAKAVPAA